MKKLNILICVLITILCCNFVLSQQIEKPLVNLSNCYNMTISVSLQEGNESAISFNGCTKTDDNEWFCNCYTTENKNFSLIMQTDDKILRSPRRYDVNIKEQYFTYRTNPISLNVDDWGDYVDLGDVDYEIINRRPQAEIRYVDRVKLVNNTVYVDRIKEVQVLREINNTVLVENTTRVDACNAELTKLQTENTMFNLSYMDLSSKNQSKISVCEINQIRMLNEMKKMPGRLFVLIVLSVLSFIGYFYLSPLFKDKVWRANAENAFFVLVAIFLLFSLILCFALTYDISERSWNIILYVCIGIVVVLALLRGYFAREKIKKIVADLKKEEDENEVKL